MKDEGTDMDLEATIRTLTDRAAIEAVINQYFFAVDVRNIDLVVACFTEDALVRLMDGQSVMRGRDEVRAAFTARQGNARLGITDIVGISHVPGNIRIEIDGDDATATTLTIAHLKGTLDGESVLMQRGLTYTDRLERIDGQWLIADRLHATRWHNTTHSIV